MITNAIVIVVELLFLAYTQLGDRGVIINLDESDLIDNSELVIFLKEPEQFSFNTPESSASFGYDSYAIRTPSNITGFTCGDVYSDIDLQRRSPNCEDETIDSYWIGSFQFRSPTNVTSLSKIVFDDMFQKGCILSLTYGINDIDKNFRLACEY